MVRVVFVACFLFLVNVVFAQKEKFKLKKKFFGIYEGVMMPYMIHSDTSFVMVEPTKMKLELQRESFILETVQIKYQGKYQIVSKNKDVYLLDVYFLEMNQIERYQFIKNERKIIRQGINPQPNVELKKMKK